ncbi:MAG: hypothetical protein R3F37_19450 [Candidatus Competibacteraceae bacterium]
MTGVISNTSPLTNLAAINQFDHLRRLCGELWIAEIWQELNAGGQRSAGRGVITSPTPLESRGGR